MFTTCWAVFFVALVIGSLAGTIFGANVIHSLRYRMEKARYARLEKRFSSVHTEVFSAGYESGRKLSEERQRRLEERIEELERALAGRKTHAPRHSF